MKREFRDYDDDDFNETDEEADDMNLIREGDEQSLRTTYIQYHHHLVRKFWVVVEKNFVKSRTKSLLPPPKKMLFIMMIIVLTTFVYVRTAAEKKN